MTAPEIRPSYLVGRVDRLIRAAFDEALAGVGLTISEFTALAVLAARPGLSNARLARRALVSAQAMSKVTLSLEGRGLIVRESSAYGGRALGASLTTAGSALLADVQPRIAAAEARLFAPLDTARRRELVASLQAVAGLEDGPAWRHRPR